MTSNARFLMGFFAYMFLVLLALGFLSPDIHQPVNPDHPFAKQLKR
jgi:hypothetical protein